MRGGFRYPASPTTMRKLSEACELMGKRIGFRECGHRGRCASAHLMSAQNRETMSFWASKVNAAENAVYSKAGGAYTLLAFEHGGGRWRCAAGVETARPDSYGFAAILRDIQFCWITRVIWRTLPRFLNREIRVKWKRKQLQCWSSPSVAQFSAASMVRIE